MATPFADRVLKARDFICAEKLFQPTVAIVLGSGLSGMEAQASHTTSITYDRIPGFVAPSAAGHAGKMVLGYLSGMPVVMFCGRTHRYEGWSDEQVRLPIHVAHALGARVLITTNAAGGLNRRFLQGELMVIDSHIDLLWSRGQATSLPRPAQPVPLSLHHGPNPYSPAFIERVHSISRGLNIRLHQGCYLATLGPTYETRAEYSMFRRVGADAVGMSTVPEVLAAAELGMETLAFSVITNVASTDRPIATTHNEVVDTGRVAGPNLASIITALLDQLSGEPD